MIRKASISSGRRYILLAVLFVTSQWLAAGSHHQIRPALARYLAPLLHPDGTTRWLEARLPGGFEHATWSIADKPSRHSQLSANPELEVAIEHFESRTRALPSQARDFDARHAKSILRLVMALDLDDLDRLIDDLRLLIADDLIHGASLHTTLSAAYLQRFDVSHDPVDIIQALEATSAALLDNSDQREAQFNRSLTLGHLFLRQGARSSWQQYLQDSKPDGWQSEAQERLNALNQSKFSPAIFIRDPPGHSVLDGSMEIREHFELPDSGATKTLWDLVENELFPAWVDAMVMDEEAKAARVVERLTFAGSWLSRETGDQFLASAATTLQTSRHLDVLVEGHQLYTQGLRQYRAQQIAKAQHSFSRSAQLLAESGSPYHLAAQRYLANCAYLARDYPLAIAQAEATLHEANLRSFYSLAGKAAWIRGTLAFEQADLRNAKAFFGHALKSFMKTRESAHQSSIYSLLATTHTFLGDTRQAWSYRYQALYLAVRALPFERFPLIFSEAAQAASEEGYFEAALAFQQETLHLELENGNPLAIAEAFWWRSSIYLEAERRQEAWEDLRNASTWCAAIEDATIREHTRAGLLVLRGKLLSHTNPRQSLDILNQALTIYNEIELFSFTTEIHLQRAKALIQLDAERQAETALLQAIEEFERQTLGTDHWLDRVRQFDQASEAFELMLGLQLRTLDMNRAWTVAERGKARWMLEQLSGSVAQPPGSLGILQEELPDDTAFLEFSVLPDQVAYWFLTRESARYGTIPVSREKLRHEINTLLNGLARAGQDPENISSLLFDRLLGRNGLPKKGHLIIVPDKELFLLPFAALLDRHSGKYLIETHVLSVVPSAAIYRTLSKRPSSSEPFGEASALVIGDPAFDQQLFPSLSRLPAANEEARSLAAQNPHSVLQTGDQATVQAFLDELDHHRIVQFSGHAEAHPKNPQLSKLIFAPGKSRFDSGEFFVWDLHNLHLQNVELVILSACGTGDGTVSNLEGSLSLAHAFLATGTPTVLATLWNVEDQTSHDFMSRFHTNLRQGSSPESALRQTQVSLLHSNNPSRHSPKNWAAFQLIGTSRKYPELRKAPL